MMLICRRLWAWADVPNVGHVQLVQLFAVDDGFEIIWATSPSYSRPRKRDLKGRPFTWASSLPEAGKILYSEKVAREYEGDPIPWDSYGETWDQPRLI